MKKNIAQQGNKGTSSAGREQVAVDLTLDKVFGLLREADVRRKAGNIPGAFAIVREAKRISPHNQYVSALEEHLETLRPMVKTQPPSVALSCGIVTAPLADPAIPRSASGADSSPIHALTTSTTGTSPAGQIDRSVQRKKIEGPAAQCSVPDEKSPSVRKPAGVASPGQQPTVESAGTIIGNDLASRPRVVVIDDDDPFLRITCTTLRDFGLDPLPFATSDEAYAWLVSNTPDAILCDVNLETSTYGGFTFFEEIQRLQHLAYVPFVFLSGLSDEAIRRTGKELGADDYLTKPYEERMLVGTLHGKIARFHRMQKRRASSSERQPALA